MGLRSPPTSTREAPGRRRRAPCAARGSSGWARPLPERRVTNGEIAERLGVDVDWIERRTGIQERRYAAPGQRVSELATSAARQALADAGLDAAELDLLLVATLAPDEITPSVAPTVAHELGAGGIAAIDVGAACTGTVAGARARCLLDRVRARQPRAGGRRRDPQPLHRLRRSPHRAAVRRRRRGARRLARRRRADRSVRVRQRRRRSRRDSRPARHRPVRDGRPRHLPGGGPPPLRVHRGGPAAARGSGWRTSTCSSTTRPTRGSSPPSRSAWSCPRERVFDCIAQLGNTSAASVPLALAAAVQSGALQPGARVVIGAIGAGMSWGATVLTWGRP